MWAEQLQLARMASYVDSAIRADDVARANAAFQGRSAEGTLRTLSPQQMRGRAFSVDRSESFSGTSSSDGTTNTL